jgi:excisionase family DNA binding protein
MSLQPNTRGENQSEMPMLLNTNEAARQLGVSESSLRRRTKEGIIPAIKLGRRVLYSRHALNSWIDGQEAA